MIVGVVVGLMVGGGIAWAAIPDDSSRAITACYPKSGTAKGALRVIDYQSGERCKAGEGTLAWQQQGMRWRGPWNAITDYAQNDVVLYNGASYVAATNPAVGHAPGGFLVWALLAARGAVGPQGPPGPAGPGLSSFDELEGQPCNLDSPATGHLQIVYSGGGVGAATLTCVPDNSQLLTVSIAGVDGEYLQHASVVGTSINCPATCVASYPNGTDVTLSVVPDTAVSFEGWTGACSGTDDCTVTLDDDRTVTANFAPVTEQTLTVDVEGNGLHFGPDRGMGSVSSTPPGLDCHIPPDETDITCSQPFPTNSEVTLHAQPSAEDYYFSGWGPGPCASAGTSPDCTLRMDSNQRASATFGIVALEVNMPSCVVGDCGSLRVTDSTGHDSTEAFDSCAGNCYWRDFRVPTGTVVTLTVTTGSHGIFEEWGGDCAGTTGTVCVLTVTRFSTADVMVTEIFPDD